MYTTMFNNDQAPAAQNINISGVGKYASGDFGASWATTAAITASLGELFENPVNGDVAFLYNTNGPAKRGYAYMNGAWSYWAIT